MTTTIDVAQQQQQTAVDMQIYELYQQEQESYEQEISALQRKLLITQKLHESELQHYKRKVTIQRQQLELLREDVKYYKNQCMELSDYYSHFHYQRTMSGWQRTAHQAQRLHSRLYRSMFHRSQSLVHIKKRHYRKRLKQQTSHREHEVQQLRQQLSETVRELNRTKHELTVKQHGGGGTMSGGETNENGNDRVEKQSTGKPPSMMMMIHSPMFSPSPIRHVTRKYNQNSKEGRNDDDDIDDAPFYSPDGVKMIHNLLSQCEPTEKRRNKNEKLRRHQPNDDRDNGDVIKTNDDDDVPEPITFDDSDDDDNMSRERNERNRKKKKKDARKSNNNDNIGDGRGPSPSRQTKQTQYEKEHKKKSKEVTTTETKHRRKQQHQQQQQQETDHDNLFSPPATTKTGSSSVNAAVRKQLHFGKNKGNNDGDEDDDANDDTNDNESDHDSPRMNHHGSGNKTLKLFKSPANKAVVNHGPTRTASPDDDDAPQERRHSPVKSVTTGRTKPHSSASSSTSRGGGGTKRARQEATAADDGDEHESDAANIIQSGKKKKRKVDSQVSSASKAPPTSEKVSKHQQQLSELIKDSPLGLPAHVNNKAKPDLMRNIARNLLVLGEPVPARKKKPK